MRSNIRTRKHSSRMRTALSSDRRGGGVPARGLRGCTCPAGSTCRGCASQHALRQTPPLVNRMTDRCKNITLPQLRFLTVIILKKFYFTTNLICNQQFTPPKDISEVEFPWTASLPPVTSYHCVFVNLKVIPFNFYHYITLYSGLTTGYLSLSCINVAQSSSKTCVTYFLVKINHISKNIRWD